MNCGRCERGVWLGLVFVFSRLILFAKPRDRLSQSTERVGETAQCWAQGSGWRGRGGSGNRWFNVPLSRVCRVPGTGL